MYRVLTYSKVRK